MVLDNLALADKPADTQVLAVVSGSDKYAAHLEKRLKEIFVKVRIVRNSDTFIDHDKLRSVQYENAYAPDPKISVIKLRKVYETYSLVVENADKNADYFWFVEDDTLFPLDVLKRYFATLDALEGDVVTGISYYWHTLDNIKRNFWKLNYKPVFGDGDTSGEYTVHLDNMKDCNDGVVRLGACGLGNVLAKRDSVLTWVPKSFLNINSGADISFFLNCTLKGYKAYGLCNVYLPHISIYSGGDIEIRGRIDTSIIPIVNKSYPKTTNKGENDGAAR
jgi:hypothetical protein